MSKFSTSSSTFLLYGQTRFWFIEHPCYFTAVFSYTVGGRCIFNYSMRSDRQIEPEKFRRKSPDSFSSNARTTITAQLFFSDKWIVFENNHSCHSIRARLDLLLVVIGDLVFLHWARTISHHSQSFACASENECHLLLIANDSRTTIE